MKIHPKHKTLWLCYAFYKFIAFDAWGIVVNDFMVRRNGARSEETKKSTTSNLALQAMSPRISR